MSKRVPLIVLLTLALASGCAPGGAAPPATPITPTEGATATPSPPPPPSPTPTRPTMDALIPRPVSASADGGSFALEAGAVIYIQPASPELRAIGEQLAERLRPATGYPLPVAAAQGAPPAGSILLTTSGADQALGAEGYALAVTAQGLTLSAPQLEGLFRGAQTIRQLLPPAIESATQQPGPWLMATGTIEDQPRFAWRGAMLDVARHFFAVEDVKRYIDIMAAYKLNRLHLHLSDDQGWRIEIKAWPNLTTHGGSTAVGGGPGGFYTQEQYAEIVAYAQSRYITVIPEIDMPGHTNAALSSYPELTCDGVAPELYTGIEVGFSSLCIEQETTYTFIDDVVRELAALTPGPYIHIGGDEVETLSDAEYAAFITRAAAIVEANGKRPIGWEEIAAAELPAGSVVQFWDTPGEALAAASKQIPVIISPASRIYLDMKYDRSTPLGQDWAGASDVRDSYDWDPLAIVPGMPAEMVLGVEAPLWTETLETRADLEYMALPRLAGVAEIGWSPAEGRSWDEYRERLAAHGPRWQAQAINFFRAPEVPWK